MTYDDRGQRGGGGKPRFRLKPSHTIIGGGVVAAAAALVLAGAYVGPLGKPKPTTGRPAVAVVAVEPRPVAITPGDKMDVLATPENGFQGVPSVEREPGLAEIFADAFFPQPEPKPEPRLRPQPQPAPRLEPRYEAVRVEPPRPLPPELPPEPVRVRRQSAERADECTYQPTRVQAMICRDSGLAAADVTLRGALREAIDNGADVRAVMSDQRRWEAARERAAVDGPDAVERMYNLRINELQTGY